LPNQALERAHGDQFHHIGEHKGMIRTLLAATALVALAATPAAAQQKLKIGFMATFSGPAGALGTDLYDGFMLGIANSGGKLGGLAVEVLKDDDQLKPDVGLQIARKYIDRDKVDIVTGVVFSNVLMAIYKPIIDSKTFLISANAGPSPTAGAQCSPFYFATSWQNDTNHEAMGKYVNDKGFKTVYLMAPNYQAGKDALSGFKRYFKGQVIEEVYTTVNQPDYSAEIAQLRAANPQAMYAFYPGGMGVNFVKQYSQAGLIDKVPMYSAFTVDSSTLPAIGDAAVGTFQTMYWNHDFTNPENQKFVADFRSKYGRLPSSYAAQAYDAALLIDSAVRKVGGKVQDKDAFRAALKAADFKSTRGPFKFNTNGYPVQDYYLLETVKGADGKPIQITRAKVFENHGDPYAKDCPLK